MPGQKLLCWDSISTFNENDLSGKDMFTKRLKVIKFMGMVMVALMAVSCVDSLNTSPIDDNVVTSNQVVENPENFKKVLAKMYAGRAVTGQQGHAGQPDRQGGDRGP